MPSGSFGAGDVGSWQSYDRHFYPWRVPGASEISQYAMGARWGSAWQTGLERGETVNRARMDSRAPSGHRLILRAGLGERCSPDSRPPTAIDHLRRALRNLPVCEAAQAAMSSG